MTPLFVLYPISRPSANPYPESDHSSSSPLLSLQVKLGSPSSLLNGSLLPLLLLEPVRIDSVRLWLQFPNLHDWSWWGLISHLSSVPTAGQLQLCPPPNPGFTSSTADCWRRRKTSPGGSQTGNRLLSLEVTLVTSAPPAHWSESYSPTWQ